MRWTLVLLAVAVCTACTRWTTYENGDDLRPELAEAALIEIDEIQDLR